MKAFIFGLVFIALIVVATCDDDCTPGDHKFDGCNHCTCAGGAWLCTLKLCLDKSQRAQRSVPVLTQEVSIQRQKRAENDCSPGDHKFDGCNHCHCAGGVWACTQKACFVKLNRDQRSAPVLTEDASYQRQKRAGYDCTPGDHKFDGCNHCNCAGGVWACTLKFCPDKSQRVQRSAPVLTEEASYQRQKRAAAAECSPGDHKNDGCNNCHCSETGLWLCTKKFCIHKREAAAECSPGDHKNDGCNNCHCSETGLWLCTKKFCIHKREAQCTPGDSKNDGCNTCHCSETGLWLCTEKLCLKKREAAAGCSPGDTKNDGCNTCHCSETGLWLCTKKFCLNQG